jgi:cobalamin biosynthetic protein CobC
MLRHAGFEIVGGTLLFRLARRAEASAWFERLGRQAILVRPFPAPHADWLRFGLPGPASEWRRLEAALSGRVASESE